jgi:hypothetical protein
MGPHRGDVQQGSASRSRVLGADAETDRAREDCAQQRGGLVFAEGVRFLEGGGASPPLRGPISDRSARAGRGLLLCASPKRKTGVAPFRGSDFTCRSARDASHLHTISD